MPIPHRNRNHTGWWIFREVEQWVPRRRAGKALPARRPVWENTRLVRADSREEAYRKAVALCRAEHPSKTNDGEWRFVGLSLLLPVYEELADGAELLWTERGRMTAAGLKKLVRSRRQLPIFDDAGPDGH